MLVNYLLTLGIAGRHLHLKTTPTPALDASSSMECSWSRSITYSNLGIPLLLTLVIYGYFIEAANVIGITTPQNHKNFTTTIVRNIYHRSWMCKISKISTVTGICDRLISKIKAQQARCPLLCEMIITRPPSDDICCTAIAHSGCVGLGRNALRKRASHKTYRFVPNSAASVNWSELADRRLWNV